MMPDAVRVHSAELAPETDAAGRRWHAIYWATGKLYTYRFYAGGAMDPMQRLLLEHGYEVRIARSLL